MTPPAPGRFSITTDWPHRFDSSSPSVRATISTAPPGGYGTKTCTGLEGYASPASAAVAPNAASAMTADNARSSATIEILPEYFLVRDYSGKIGGPSLRARGAARSPE